MASEFLTDTYLELLNATEAVRALSWWHRRFHTARRHATRMRLANAHRLAAWLCDLSATPEEYRDRIARPLAAARELLGLRCDKEGRAYKEMSP